VLPRNVLFLHRLTTKGHSAQEVAPPYLASASMYISSRGRSTCTCAATHGSSLSLDVHGSSTKRARSPYHAVHHREVNHAEAAATDRAPRRRLRLTCIEETRRLRRRWHIRLLNSRACKNIDRITSNSCVSDFKTRNLRFQSAFSDWTEEPRDIRKSCIGGRSDQCSSPPSVSASHEDIHKP
jgi:hypothetical protein